MVIADGQFYGDGMDESMGINNDALIQDFNRAAGDRIVLHGESSDYVLRARPKGVRSGLALFLKTSGENELIAVL